MQSALLANPNAVQQKEGEEKSETQAKPTFDKACLRYKLQRQRRRGMCRPQSRNYSYEGGVDQEGYGSNAWVASDSNLRCLCSFTRAQKTYVWETWM